MENGEAELNLIHIGERPEGFDLEEFAHEELESPRKAFRRRAA